jgi:hypothetical protein
MLDIRPNTIWRAIFPPFASAIAGMIVVTGVTRLLGTQATPPALAMATLSGVTGFAAAMFAGDMLGLWRGYVEDILGFLRESLKGAP